MRPSAKPPAGTCPENPNQFFNVGHQWEHSYHWNGNDKSVIPWHQGTTGIGRSGWRCFHCNKWAWDQSDLEFAATFADAGTAGRSILKVITEYKNNMLTIGKVNPSTFSLGGLSEMNLGWDIFEADSENGDREFQLQKEDESYKFDNDWQAAQAMLKSGYAYHVMEYLRLKSPAEFHDIRTQTGRFDPELYGE